MQRSFDYKSWQRRANSALANSLGFLGFSCDSAKLTYRVFVNLEGAATVTAAGNVTVELRANDAQDRAVFYVENDGPRTDKSTQIDDLIARAQGRSCGKEFRCSRPSYATNSPPSMSPSRTTRTARPPGSRSDERRPAPFLPADANAAPRSFAPSIEELAADDYNEAQREAWAARADDETGFRREARGGADPHRRDRRRRRRLRQPQRRGQIDMLFVDPEFARQGAGRALIDALDQARPGARRKRLTAEASDVAKPLFERQGFAAAEAQSRPRRRPMARQHHHDQGASARAPAPARH